MGYELQVVKATAVLSGRALEISVTITNRGVAPFYADWPIQIAAVRSEGSEFSAKLPFALNKLLPAASDTQSVKLDLAKLAPGETKLLLGIPNPLKGGKLFRFANVDQDRDRAGWLTLGKVVIPDRTHEAQGEIEQL